MQTRRAPAPTPPATAAAELITEMATDPVGEVVVSVYESGRLVALAPWLAGHQARRQYLLRSQRPDGWGGPGGYTLVPTLSATVGLLAELGRPVDPAVRDRLTEAAVGGLRALHDRLATGGPTGIPDTVASELVVPALIEEVNRLAPTRPGLPGGLTAPLPTPAGFDPRPLEKARARCAAGEVPPALTYGLDALGPVAGRARSVRPEAGAVGCSPAATAVWAAGPDGPRESLDYLDAVQARGGGPVPVVAPITYFEPAWTLSGLGAAGLTSAAPPAALKTLLGRLEEGLADTGVPPAPGLPPDSDDTSVTLAALVRHHRIHSPDPLLGFQVDGHFLCFHGERDPSVGANAHVLEALALFLAERPDHRGRYGPAAATAARWLLGQQTAEGSWSDKWHASPYYGTACTVPALALHGGPDTVPAIARAVSWLLASQRPDGSWGRWQGSVEETSYAVQVLAAHADGDHAREAVRRGRGFLADPPVSAVDVPLWHGKELYTPVRVVRAARLAALQLASVRR